MLGKKFRSNDSLASRRRDDRVTERSLAQHNSPIPPTMKARATNTTSRIAGVTKVVLQAFPVFLRTHLP